MDGPEIWFQTTDKRNISQSSGYDDVSTTDLATFLRQAREAAASLEGELMKRQPKRVSERSNQIEPFCRLLHDMARTLDVVERLESATAAQVCDAVQALACPQTTAVMKRYDAFLRDVLRLCGRTSLLLVVASLSKKTIMHMNAKNRVDLLAYLKAAKSSLDVPILSSLANEFDVPLPNSK